jgi:hypothetical protein
MNNRIKAAIIMAFAMLASLVIVSQMEHGDFGFRLIMFFMIMIVMMFAPVLLIAVYGLILSLLDGISEDQNTNEYDD